MKLINNALTNNQSWAKIHQQVSCYKKQIFPYQIYQSKIQNNDVSKCISLKYIYSTQTDIVKF